MITIDKSRSYDIMIEKILEELRDIEETLPKVESEQGLWAYQGSVTTIRTLLITDDTPELHQVCVDLLHKIETRIFGDVRPKASPAQLEE